jgi:glucokinase
VHEGLAIGIDAGGTKVAGLLVDCDEGGKVLERTVVVMPADDAEQATETVVEVAADLLARAGGSGRPVGIGAAGMVDLDGVMRFAPNIAWREAPLARRISDFLGVPAFLDNDANVAAWGEYRFGAGRDSADMLLVTVGTGIGGGIVSSGHLYRGAHGFGAEIGHIIVEPGGPRCGCGNLGCWEQVASGHAIDRLARQAAAEYGGTLIVELAGGDPSAVDGHAATEAARRGDPIALGILTNVGSRLGQGIAGLVNVLDPDLVVIGGGAVTAGDLLLEPARESFRDAVEAPEHRPEVPIVPAALGNDAGAIGAADLALTRVREAAKPMARGGGGAR